MEFVKKNPSIYIKQSDVYYFNELSNLLLTTSKTSIALFIYFAVEGYRKKIDTRIPKEVKEVFCNSL